MPVDSNAALKTIELLELYRGKLSSSSANQNLIDAIDRVLDVFNSQFFIALLGKDDRILTEIQQFYNEILLNESIPINDKTQQTLKLLQTISQHNRSTISDNNHHQYPNRNHHNCHQKSSANVGRRLATEISNNSNNDNFDNSNGYNYNKKMNNNMNNNMSENDDDFLSPEEEALENSNNDAQTNHTNKSSQNNILYSSEFEEEDDEDEDGNLTDEHSRNVNNDTKNNEDGHSPLIKRPIIMEAVIVKSEEKGYGFSVAGGIDNPYFHSEDPGIYVTKIKSGGIADTSGSLKINDQILSVNGINMTYLTHEAAVCSLKDAGNKLNLVIQRDPTKRKPRIYGREWNKQNSTETTMTQEPSERSNPSTKENIFRPHASKLNENNHDKLNETEYSPRKKPLINTRSFSSSTRSNTSGNGRGANKSTLSNGSSGNKVVCVSLVKSERGLGFSIGGGRGNEHFLGDPGIYITKVSDKGVAQQTGQIHEGDQLLQVNEYLLTDVSHEDAVNILCSVGNRVDLKLLKAAHRSHHNTLSLSAPYNNITTSNTTATQSEISRCSSSKEIVLSESTEEMTEEAGIITDDNMAGRDSVLSPENLFDEDQFSKRSARVVVLERSHATSSLGFNIVGGEDEDGIFVSYVNPDGIAELSQNIFVGDRIWQVNGEDISTATHDEAATLLKNAGHVVELLVTTDLEEYMVFESKFSNWSAFEKNKKNHSKYLGHSHTLSRHPWQQQLESQLPQPTNKWLSSKSTPNLIEQDSNIDNSDHPINMLNDNNSSNSNIYMSRGQSPLPLDHFSQGQKMTQPSVLSNYNKVDDTHRSLGDILDDDYDLRKSGANKIPENKITENSNNSAKYKSCRSINVFTENHINSSIQNKQNRQKSQKSSRSNNETPKEQTATYPPMKIDKSTSNNQSNFDEKTEPSESSGAGIVKKNGFYVRALFNFDPDQEKNVPSRPLTFLNNDIMLIVNSADSDWWQARLIEDSNETGPLGIIPSPRRLYRKEKRQKKKVNFDYQPNSTSVPGTNQILSRSLITNQSDLLDNHKSTNETTGNKKSTNENSVVKRSSSKLSNALMKRFSSSNSISRSVQNLSLNAKQSQGQLSGQKLEKYDSGPLLINDEKIDDSKIMQLYYEPLLKISLNYVRPIVIIGPMREKINDKLIAEFPELFASCVPHTTRPQRPYEEHGKDYFFVKDRRQMENDIKHQRFIEAGQYRGNLYGTSIDAVREISLSKHCVLDVSALAIKRLVANSLLPITVLIRPVSVKALCGISSRITVQQADLQVKKAEELYKTLSHYFTAVIWEDTFGSLYSKVKSIIQANSGTDIWVPKSQNMLVL